MNRTRVLTLAFWALLGVHRTALAQDITRLGGDLTSDLPTNVAIELPAPNVTNEARFLLHIEGHTPFHQTFDLTKDEQGRLIVGPSFNHNSCGGCHLRDGKGKVKLVSSADVSTMLVRVSLRGGLQPDGSPIPVPKVGDQLQDHTSSGKTRFNINLTWDFKTGEYRDGTRYELRIPRLKFTIPGRDTSKILRSLRMSPSIIGMGLLEAVPDSTIEAMADPDDLDGDGISGRVSRVIDLATNTTKIGRFGFKATNPNLRQQSAAAFFFDMGMTNELFQDPNQSLEVSSDVLDKVVFYQQVPGVTPAREQDHPDVIAGKALFQQLNCDSCHKMTLQTTSSDITELQNQTFHPFTDLLLHDMGPGLADNRPEFSASGREWRTTPLWGIGLARVLNNNAPGFLHDGRARNIPEAILWHGGEAAKARNAFKALKKSDRAKLIRFLKSL